MLKVYCEKCNTAYQVKADKVPLSGGKLKCSVCNNIIPVFNKNKPQKPANKLSEKPIKDHTAPQAIKKNQPKSWFPSDINEKSAKNHTAPQAIKKSHPKSWFPSDINEKPIKDHTAPQAIKKSQPKSWFPSDISKKPKKKSIPVKTSQINSHRAERLLRLITNFPLYLIFIDLFLVVILFFTNFNIELRRTILVAVTLSSAFIIFNIILLLAHFDRKERQKAEQDSVHELFLFCYPLYLFRRGHVSEINPINKITQNLILLICFIIVYGLIFTKLLSISRNILEKLQI